MPKGVVQDSRASTALTSLREAVHELEIGAAKLKGRKKGVLDVLRSRDELARELARLQEQGLDLRSEMTRVQTVDNTLASSASTIQRELRSVGGLSGAREQENPPESHWWWYLDSGLARARRKQIIKPVAITLGIVALLLVGNYVMDKLYGLSPVEKEALGHVYRAQTHVVDGEIDAAIAEYEQGVAVLPTMGDAQVALGFLYRLKGRMEEAERAFAAGEAAFADRSEYLLNMAQGYWRNSELETALITANEAIDLAPDSPQAFLIRGGIYESRKDTGKAVQDYQHAADLAGSQGLDDLYVIAKMDLANLFQYSGDGF